MDRSLTTAAGVVATTVIIALVAWPRQSPPPPVEFVASVTRRTATVHVSGAVVRPGLVVLSPDARVADAILAVGGATREADLGSLNLAATVSDGARLSVPFRGEGGPASDDGPVRINVATVDDLQRLPGVGPVLAERIVAFREANGSFDTIEDLLDVSGIGENKLAAIRDSILVP